MRLPNVESASVGRAKIADYLLSSSHPSGRHKASFFVSFGFSRDACEELSDALVLHARSNEVARSEVSRFGTRYVIEGSIRSPDGRSPTIRAVWFISTNTFAPYFVTAYPLLERLP
jgi:hypothetical protein